MPPRAQRAESAQKSERSEERAVGRVRASVETAAAESLAKHLCSPAAAAQVAPIHSTCLPRGAQGPPPGVASTVRRTEQLRPLNWEARARRVRRGPTHSPHECGVVCADSSTNTGLGRRMSRGRGRSIHSFASRVPSAPMRCAGVPAGDRLIPNADDSAPGVWDEYRALDPPDLG